MNIAILMQNIQSLGGIQRVVTAIFNQIAEDDFFKIYVISPNDNGETLYYHVSDKIQLIDQGKFRRNVTFINRAIIKANKHYAFLDHFVTSRLTERVYFGNIDFDKLENFLISERIDCVIGANAYYSIICAIISKDTGIRSIAWMHSTYDSYFEMRGRETYGLRQLFVKNAQYINDFLVLTNKDRMLFGEKIKSLKCPIMVTYNPVTIQATEVSRLNTGRLLFVGRIRYEHKGCDMLIPIILKVRKTYPDIKLDVVGDGIDFERLSSDVAAAGLDDNIILHGSSNNVKTFYEEASVLLLTSRYEGFGLVITEAMAFGVPTVAFHAYGPDEIIEDGISGFLVEQEDVDSFADKIVELISDRNKLYSMSAAAIHRSEEFNLDTVVEKWKSLLRGIK